MARQSRVPCLLLTRPAPQSQRFAQEIAARLGQVSIVISPLMEPRFLQPDLPAGPFRAVIFTSETGVQAAQQLSADLPGLAYCVGDRTADAARAAGFKAISAKGDASALLALVAAQAGNGALLHLRGEKTTGSVAETLTRGGLETESVVIYRQKPVALSRAATALFHHEAPVLIPVFSPRSALLLAAALPPSRKAPIWIVAISPQTAEAAREIGAAQMVIAGHPDSENMLHAVAGVYSSASGA